MRGWWCIAAFVLLGLVVIEHSCGVGAWIGWNKSRDWHEQNVVLPKEDGMPVLPAEREFIIERGGEQIVVRGERGKARRRISIMVDDEPAPQEYVEPAPSQPTPRAQPRRPAPAPQPECPPGTRHGRRKVTIRQ